MLPGTFFTCLIKFIRVYSFIAYLNKEMGINEHSDLTNFSEYISNEISSGAPVNYGLLLAPPVAAATIANRNIDAENRL
jgi:hypothetical protein